jgi:hypothetical protein
MKIIIAKVGYGQSVRYRIIIQDGTARQIWLDDPAHTDIKLESEIMARADALRGATGWPIHKEYEL